MRKPDIRPTDVGDIPDLTKVLEDTGLFPPEMLPDMLEAPEEGFWLTGFIEGEGIALCYARPEALAAGVWNMLALGVRGDLQGQGIGAAMVADVESQLRQQEARLLIVETSGTPDFAQARGFYEANGYEAEARIRDYWDPGDDKVIYRKVL